MSLKISLGEAHSEFDRQAPAMVVRSDRAKLKRLFAGLTAAAVVQEGWQARDVMTDALREAFLEPSRHVRRNLFKDL